MFTSNLQQTSTTYNNYVCFYTSSCN